MAIGSVYESTYCIGRLFILLEIQELPDLALKIMFLRYMYVTFPQGLTSF